MGWEERINLKEGIEELDSAMIYYQKAYDLSEEINNESFDSLNKSKNVFDIDFPQEENKSENNEFSQDLLNNSCTTFNCLYNNNCNTNNSDAFSYVNK